MKFDPNATSPKLWPEEWYDAQIEDAEDGTSKSSGKPMTTVVWKIARRKPGAAAWDFQKVWSRYVWTNKSHVTMFKKVCQAVGLDTSSGNVPANLLVGKRCQVFLKSEVDESGKYDDKNIVSGMRPSMTGGTTPGVEYAPRYVEPTPSTTEPVGAEGDDGCPF